MKWNPVQINKKNRSHYIAKRSAKNDIFEWRKWPVKMAFINYTFHSHPSPLSQSSNALPPTADCKSTSTAKIKNTKNSYVETFDERLQVSEKFLHRVLLWIKRKILGRVLEHCRHLLIHAFKHFHLLLGSVQKLVQHCQERRSQLQHRPMPISFKMHVC